MSYESVSRQVKSSSRVSVSHVSIWVFLTFEFKFLIVMEFTEIAKSRQKLYACENQLYIQHIINENVNCYDN